MQKGYSAMHSRQPAPQNSRGSNADLLGMLNGERKEVVDLLRIVIKHHLGGDGKDNPRDRQAKFQRLIHDIAGSSVDRGRKEQ